MKKIINVLLCAALAVSNFTVVSYAEESDKNNYTTIDISSVANAPIYAKEGDNWSSYSATAPNAGYGIDVDVMSAKLTNGKLIYGETPYLMSAKTGENTAINTGGATDWTFKRNGKGVTNPYNYTGTNVDVADGYYSSLKVLASATGNFAQDILKARNADADNTTGWVNASKLALVLQYEDGEPEIVEALTTNPTAAADYNINKADFPTDIVIGEKTVKAPTLRSNNYLNGIKVITNYLNWAFNAENPYSPNNTGSGDYYIGEYDFPIDNTRVLKSIHVVGASADFDGVRLKADGTADYATYNTDKDRYYANKADKQEGMYASVVYAMTAVTKDSDLKSVLSAKLDAVRAAGTITQSDIIDISAILKQAKKLGIELSEAVELYEKTDIKPYANQAAYAKVGDLAYDKRPTVGTVYMDDTLSELGENDKYPKAYIKTGVSIDHFKNFGDGNGREPSAYTNWTGYFGHEKTTPTWGNWESGKTTNTLTFRNIPYLMNVETDAYTNIDTGANDVKMTGVDVDINDGYYNELKILSSASEPVLQKAEAYKNWNNMSKLALKLDYDDGSYDVVDYLVNEIAATHSMNNSTANNPNAIINNIINKNAADAEIENKLQNPQTMKITSYDQYGNSTVKQEPTELTQANWWNGFDVWTVSAQKLESDWASKFQRGPVATYPCSTWYKTNQDILSTIENLTEEQRINWINGTEPRYMYGTNSGAKAGINVFTIPVDFTKMLVNVHFVGSLASNDGVQVDKNGKVIYSTDNEIADGKGAYNNSIWAMTAVTKISADTTVSPDLNTDIYVSPNGSDNNTGTINAPLASLEGVKKLIRGLDKTSGKINVYFRGGRYYMQKPVIFSEEDSGTEDCPITYSAYKNEKPEFVGGIYLDGKKAKLANDDRIKSGNVYCIDLAEAGIGEIPELTPNGQGAAYNANGFELFIDDKAYFPARWPNKDAEEYNTYEKIISVTETGDSSNSAAQNPQMIVSDSAAEKIASWSNADEAFIGGYPGLPYFDFGFKFTANGTTVNLDRKCNGGIKKDGLIYFCNIAEELDSNGEYYIDRENKKLYFYSDEAPSNKNILLTTTDVGQWNKGLITVYGADNINFKGLSVNGCIGFGMALQKGRNINVSGCTFKNVSESGAYVGEFHSSYKYAYGRLDDDTEYVQRGNLVNNIKFTGCKFLNTGYSGLNVSGGNRKTLEGADIEIYGCEFENFGRIICAYSPGIRMDGVGINVRNCTVHRGDSNGIMSGGNDCIIENNNIYDVARECTDCGIIYLHKGLKNGIVVRNNYIHDITDEHGTNHMLNYNPAAKVHGKIAVYNDGAGSMLTVENNIIKDVPVGFYSIGFGNKVNNNIFIDVKYPIRTRENNILISKIKQADGTYVNPEFNEELGDTAFAEFGYLEQDGEKNPVWAVKYPEVFTCKEELKERGTNAIYPKNDVSDNLITYIKYTDYANQIMDIFADRVITEKSVMDLAGSDYSNIVFELSVDFADAENGDFSIAKDSDILNVLPGLRKNHTK